MNRVVDPTLSVADIARLSGVPVSRILTLVRLGACPAWTASGPDGKRRWTAASLPDWGHILHVTGAVGVQAAPYERVQP